MMDFTNLPEINEVKEMFSNKKTTLKGTKKLFIKKGTCSQTFFYILNREFGHIKENEERAIDPMAGGIIQLGYQCGMLWGASMGVGAESFRKNDDKNQAIGIAISATQHIMESFINRTKSADCSEITSCDWSSKFSMLKHFISGKFFSCFKLADKWAPEAIQAAKEGLSKEETNLPETPMSCASEVARKMGATDEQAVMVAGFAGGLGLSGNACGALAAAIWMNTLGWCKETPGKSALPNPAATRTLEAFYGATDYELLCSKISGQSFRTIGDHTEFIENGGCEKLIDVLAGS